MKPILNLNEITDFQRHEQGSFSAKYANISTKIGAKNVFSRVVCFGGVVWNDYPTVILRSITLSLVAWCIRIPNADFVI